MVVVSTVTQHSETGPAHSDASSGGIYSDNHDENDIASPEFLESLLVKARVSLTNRRHAFRDNQVHDEDRASDVLSLDPLGKSSIPLPPLDAGRLLPLPYFSLKESFGPSSSSIGGSTLLRDPSLALAEATMASTTLRPATPLLSAKTGKPLTKREKREIKDRTAGREWFDLEAPTASDLPRLYKEVEAMRMKNALDPKRYYRKDDGEGKGIKGLPKYFAIGKVVEESTPFGTKSSDNLTRAEKKRTIVEELVEDSEARSSAKRKFDELQKFRGNRGRGTLHTRNMAKRSKW